MGRDKAWIEYNGKPLIQNTEETLRKLGVTEVFVSGRAGVDYSALNCPVLYDLAPDVGPLAGIERGLHACASPLLLVLAVDLPRMTPRFLKKLVARCDLLTGIVPKLRDELEPLAAIYPKSCHATALAVIARHQHAARDFASACLRKHAIRTFPVSSADAACFTNWNNPEERIGKKTLEPSQLTISHPQP